MLRNLCSPGINLKLLGVWLYTFVGWAFFCDRMKLALKKCVAWAQRLACAQVTVTSLSVQQSKCLNYCKYLHTFLVQAVIMKCAWNKRCLVYINTSVHSIMCLSVCKMRCGLSLQVEKFCSEKHLVIHWRNWVCKSSFTKSNSDGT